MDCIKCVNCLWYYHDQTYATLRDALLAAGLPLRAEASR